MANQRLTWLYHKDHEPITVSLDDRKKLKRLEKEGWKDSPAKVHEDEPESVDKEGDVEADQRLYSSLLPKFRKNPGKMKKEELIELGELLNVKLYKMWAPATMIKKINEAIGE